MAVYAGRRRHSSAGTTARLRDSDTGWAGTEKMVGLTSRLFLWACLFGRHQIIGISASAWLWDKQPAFHGRDLDDFAGARKRFCCRSVSCELNGGPLAAWRFFRRLKAGENQGLPDCMPWTVAGTLGVLKVCKMGTRGSTPKPDVLLRIPKTWEAGPRITRRLAGFNWRSYGALPRSSPPVLVSGHFLPPPLSYGHITPLKVEGPFLALQYVVPPFGVRQEFRLRHSCAAGTLTTQEASWGGCACLRPGCLGQVLAGSSSALGPEAHDPQPVCRPPNIICAESDRLHDQTPYLSTYYGPEFPFVLAARDIIYYYWNTVGIGFCDLQAGTGCGRDSLLNSATFLPTKDTLDWSVKTA